MQPRENQQRRDCHEVSEGKIRVRVSGALDQTRHDESEEEDGREDQAAHSRSESPDDCEDESCEVDPVLHVKRHDVRSANPVKNGRVHDRDAGRVRTGRVWKQRKKLRLKPAEVVDGLCLGHPERPTIELIHDGRQAGGAKQRLEVHDDRSAEHRDDPRHRWEPAPRRQRPNSWHRSTPRGADPDAGCDQSHAHDGQCGCAQRQPGHERCGQHDHQHG